MMLRKRFAVHMRSNNRVGIERLLDRNAPNEWRDFAGDFVEPAEEPEPVRRVKQQNIKVSEDCCAAFAAIAKALCMTKAQLFEDMVAERLEQLQRQGVKVETAAG